jgi:hypothetical protein
MVSAIRFAWYALTRQVLLLLHYYAVETYLYEIALDEKVDASRYGSFSTTRLGLLFACLQSAKLFFETFYVLPGPVYFDLPYSIWTLVSHMNVMLSKLSLCVVDGWDHDYVSETLNFHAVLDKLSARVAEAIQTASRSQEDATLNNSLPRSVPLIFVTIETKIREVKAVHDARRADLSRRSQPGALPTEQVQGAVDEVPVLPDDFSMMDSLDFFDFGDDAFLGQNWP